MSKFFPLLESLARNFPVQDIPNGSKVFCLSVLVLQIVGVLPSINAENWRVLSNNWVLVGVCLDLHCPSLVVLDKPCPAAALDTCESTVELGLEIAEGAV